MSLQQDSRPCKHKHTPHSTASKSHAAISLSGRMGSDHGLRYISHSLDVGLRFSERNFPPPRSVPFLPKIWSSVIWAAVLSEDRKGRKIERGLLRRTTEYRGQNEALQSQPIRSHSG